MKVGIMSMQRVVNYGSFLQAYGLCNTLKSMGCEVQFVDYAVESPICIENNCRKQNIIINKVSNIIKILSPSYRAWRNRQKLMNKTFGEFVKEYNEKFLPLLGISKDYNYLPELDLLVIGSDEVFNCTQSGTMVGYSRQLFGKDNRARLLISYAATFGTTTMEKLKNYNIADEVSQMLGKFAAISVRDEHSVGMIKELCEIEPKQHIDPVLLYEFPEVNDIHIDMSDYIVVYAYADRLNDKEIKAVRDFAKKHNKKILSLGFYQPFCDEYVLANPIEVLAYIKNADYVITDTFHGTVFSIKYGKKFATIVRESNKQKLIGLLKVFNLENRSVEDLLLLERIVEQELPYDIFDCIESERRNAIDYLKVQLNVAERLD